MTLKNAVNELFDFAKAHGCDLTIAYAKKAQEIKEDAEHPMTLEELDLAREFAKVHYNIVVDARQTGNEEEYDEALATWRK